METVFVLILTCMQPVYLDDPNFVQGSEKFFDVYQSSEGKVQVAMTTGDLRKEVIFKSENTAHANFDFNEIIVSASWKGEQGVTMALRDFETRWYGEFWFPNGFKSQLLNQVPGSNIELSCIRPKNSK